MDNNILVSVVLPVKNGDSWLNDTIPALLDQEIKGQIEIIAIDSGSTDKSLDILSSYPIIVVNIKPSEFNHGLTRNLGVQKARGKFVVMTVQDAKPVSRYWLQELLKGFLDESVAGVCGQQIVTHDKDKNPVAWYRPISKPEITKYQFPDKDYFSKISPEELLSYCRWDDVNAIYRRDVLIRIPFRKTDFAEDALWAKDALINGYSIVYNPTAQVSHYHLENYQYAFNRNFTVGYHFYKYFKVIPSKGGFYRRFISIVKTLIFEKKISASDKFKWLKYNFMSQRAVINSNSLIIKSLSEDGEDGLDRVYENSNRLVPQAIKNLIADE